jgi:hypothetical protein
MLEGVDARHVEGQLDFAGLDAALEAVAELPPEARAEAVVGNEEANCQSRRSSSGRVKVTW